MSDYFPSEILIEILLRLPVKPLVRFRCVSKSWYSLISNSDFIYLHTNHTIKNTPTTKFLVRSYPSTAKIEKYAIHCDDASFTQCKEICSPLFHRPEYCYLIVGSINGLVCLSTGFSAIIFWNPALEKYLAYPMPKIAGIGSPFLSILGFGFDSKSNDYKVVKFGYHQVSDGFKLALIGVEIFELKRRAWRRLSDSDALPPSKIFSSQTQAFLNGVVHWFGLHEDDHNLFHKFLITFDMSDEKVGEMDLPLGSDVNLNSKLMVLDESLCFAYNEHATNICFIWVMKEYGVRDSWTKRFTINMDGHLPHSLGVRKNGSILQVDKNGELVSYDPLSNRIYPLGIIGSRYIMHVETYIESLVLLDKPGDGLEIGRF